MNKRILERINSLYLKTTDQIEQINLRITNLEAKSDPFNILYDNSISTLLGESGGLY